MDEPRRNQKPPKKSYVVFFALILLVIGFAVLSEMGRSGNSLTELEGKNLKSLRLVWSLPGGWVSVSVQKSGILLFAVTKEGKIAEVDSSGHVHRELHVPAGIKGIEYIRSANLGKKEEQDFITYATWSHDLNAYDSNGSPLWSYDESNGIDEAVPVDIDHTEADNILIGYNGGGGVHLLDHSGKLIWKFLNIGNAWTVSSGDFRGHGQDELVSSSAQGYIYVFDKAGKYLGSIPPPTGIYPAMVRLARISPNDLACTAFLGGPGSGYLRIAALDMHGKEKWRVQYGKGWLTYLETVESAKVSTSRPWLAAGSFGSFSHYKIAVIDITQGKLLAYAIGGRGKPDVNWLEGPSPLLLVADGDSLNAYRLE